MQIIWTGRKRSASRHLISPLPLNIKTVNINRLQILILDGLVPDGAVGVIVSAVGITNAYTGLAWSFDGSDPDGSSLIQPGTTFNYSDNFDLLRLCSINENAIVTLNFYI